MSRIIRCPSCAAVYPLEIAQIQAAHGWLRCGRCQEAFNGTGLDVPADTLEWAHMPDGLAVKALGAAPSADALHRVALDELLLREDRSGPTTAAPEPVVSADLMAFSEALATFRPSDPPLASTLPMVATTGQTKARIFLYALAAALGLLLAGQVFFLQRHAMVALWPNSRQVLENLCGPFNCQLNPWMNSKALVMEDASFAQKDESFVLKWTLRNTGPMTVATPSLELSLLDEFNNPLVRRVFLSNETPAPVALSPGQVWRGSLTVQVDPLLVFTQYRLLSFYP